MSKALITSDLHFTDQKRDAYRFASLFHNIKMMTDKVKGIDELFILGDLTEKTNNHSSVLLNSIVDLFHKIQNETTIKETFILKGNHDIQGSVPYFRFLNYIPSMTFIETVYQYSDKIIFVPNRRDGFLTDSDERLIQDNSLILTHYTFSGAKNDNGTEAHGIELPSWFKDRNIQVISGDLHTPQPGYVGSPYHIDFGDSFKPRCFVLDTETLNYKSYDLIHEVDKYLINISSLSDIKQLESLKENSIVKIRYTLTQNDAKGLSTIQESVKQIVKESGINLYDEEIVIMRTEEEKLKSETKRNLTPIEIVEVHAQEKGLGEDMKKKGVEIVSSKL